MFDIFKLFTYIIYYTSEFVVNDTCIYIPHIKCGLLDLVDCIYQEHIYCFFSQLQ